MDWQQEGPLLVVGNPPWVTNAAQGRRRSRNLPKKSNLKGLKGIDALTGASNFDIAEFIWLKLITELASAQPRIALLCKTSVARNVLRFAANARLPISDASIRRIDAKRWFGAATDACLFSLHVGSKSPEYTARVYRDLSTTRPESVIGVVGGGLVADLETYETVSYADGVCPFAWRQGLKHDASTVMELTRTGGCLWNKLGEPVEVEADFVYPLAKGSDVFRGDHDIGHVRAVIVTQQRLNEDTSQLERTAPQLWRYLTDHSEIFERRASSIYRGRPPFALFGIGSYAFAPYKVAVSGMHKKPVFRVIGPIDSRPVMLDDTCYFVPCHDPRQAALLASILNGDLCLQLFQSLVFWDSKRPITRRVLQRVDLKALLERSDRTSLVARANLELRRSGLHAITSWPVSLEHLVGEEVGARSTPQLTLFST